MIGHAPSFTWRDGAGSGTLDATWQRAALLTGGEPIDLGRVVVNAKPATDGITGAVRNAGGDVAIDGTFGIRDGVTSAMLKLSPTAHAPASLPAMLRLLGPVDQSGAVTLTWRSDRG